MHEIVIRTRFIAPPRTRVKHGYRGGGVLPEERPRVTPLFQHWFVSLANKIEAFRTVNLQ